MLRTLQASLTVLAATAIAILVMIVALPTHARGGAGEHLASTDIRPAVLVEYSRAPAGDAAAAPTCPALAKTASSCPYLAGKAQQDARGVHGPRQNEAARPAECPYLGKMTARGGCPALSDRTAKGQDCPYLAEMPSRGDCPALSEGTERRSACPYLSGKDRRGSCPRDRGADAPHELTL
jgi:hypothetical protein